MTPSPFTAGNPGTSRGGVIDLPTPKRAANIYVGRKAPVPSAADLSALEMTSDGELPALLGDLGLDEALEPALLALDGGGVQSPTSVLSLDLRDLPAPVGPRPRSPLSTRGGAASAGSVPRPPLPISPRGPSSKPGVSEPEPLPAPPTRDPLLGETLPPAAAVEGKKVSRPDLARLPLVESLGAPLPAERVTVPSVALPPAQRDTQPAFRRASPSGSLAVTKPVHALFDASEPAPPVAARPTETTPPVLALPALPSDESGGKGPAATSATNAAATSAAGSISESSGQSFITGGPGTSSTATTDPKPLRMGYLIVALAVLALLLALIVARIAGIWNQQANPGSAPAPASAPRDPGHRPSP